MNTMVIKLLIDHRESAVLRHPELLAIPHETMQLTTGDYAIFDTERSQILAIFERKTFEDQAASFKDGRANNKAKMIAARARTGCRLVYLFEGEAFPSPSKCFGHVPYHAIESSMFHMMIRDNIMIIRTKDTLDTAHTLARFVESMRTLVSKCDPLDDSVDASELLVDAAAAPTDSIALLTASVVIPDIDHVRSIWSCYKGITTESADEFMAKWTPHDIISGRLNPADIRGFKYRNGKSPNKRVIDSLVGACCLQQQVRMLACVPLLSKPRARELLSRCSLRELLSYGVVGIEMKVVNGRKIGKKAAENIIRLFNWKIMPQNTVVVRSASANACATSCTNVSTVTTAVLTQPQPQSQTQPQTQPQPESVIDDATMDEYLNLLNLE